MNLRIQYLINLVIRPLKWLLKSLIPIIDIFLHTDSEKFGSFSTLDYQISVAYQISIASRNDKHSHFNHTVNIYRYGLGMIIGNTFVILVYRYFTYKFCRYVHQIIFQMPIRYVLKYVTVY